MPKILINEVDKTTPGTGSLKTDVVFVPGFATITRSYYDNYTARAKVNIPIMCETVAEFETYFGKLPAIFKEDQPWNWPRSKEDGSPIDGFDSSLKDFDVGSHMFEKDTPDPSYLYAKELLAQGLPVLYVRVNKDNEAPSVKTMYSALSGIGDYWSGDEGTTIFSLLLDKGEYTVKFITSGGYPTFGWKGGNTSYVKDASFYSDTITGLEIREKEFLNTYSADGTYQFIALSSSFEEDMLEINSSDLIKACGIPEKCTYDIKLIKSEDQIVVEVKDINGNILVNQDLGKTPKDIGLFITDIEAVFGSESSIDLIIKSKDADSIKILEDKPSGWDQIGEDNTRFIEFNLTPINMDAKPEGWDDINNWIGENPRFANYYRTVLHHSKSLKLNAKYTYLPAIPHIPGKYNRFLYINGSGELQRGTVGAVFPVNDYCIAECSNNSSNATYVLLEEKPADWDNVSFPQDKYCKIGLNKQNQTAFVLLTSSEEFSSNTYYEFKQGANLIPAFSSTEPIGKVELNNLSGKCLTETPICFVKGLFGDQNITLISDAKYFVSGPTGHQYILGLPTSMVVDGAITRGDYIDVEVAPEGGAAIPVKMENIAKLRGDTVALIDHTNNRNRPLNSLNLYSLYYRINNTENAITSDGTYGAMFTPWFNFTLPYTGVSIDLPGSFAYLIGLARSILNDNPNWFSIAGVTRGKVAYYNRALTSDNLTQSIADSYQPRSGGAALNPITKVKPYGEVIWGNRTLHRNADGLTASSFLDIRNMVSDVKRVVYDTAIKLIFEKNTDVLWAKFCAGVNTYLDKLLSGQGITGYKVIKGQTDEKAKLVAIVRLSPIYSLEDVDVTIELVDEDVIVS